jgi:two-component sensor histidine kinase
MIRYIQTGENKSLHLKQFGLFVFLGLIVMIIDSFTPVGFSEWVLYMIFLVIYRKISASEYIIPLTICYIIFVIVGFILSPDGIAPIYGLINRSAAIVAIVIISYLSVRERNIKIVNAEIIERISDSFLALDHEGRVIYNNKTALDLSGRDKLLGKILWEEIPVLKNSIYHEKVNEAFSKQLPVEFKMQSLVSPFLYQVSIYPSARGVSIFSKNVTEIEKAEKQLHQTLKEKELLLREIHHRVKNNFQLISSLLGLSSHNINDPHLLEIISVLQRRIRTLATIHEKLYLSKSIDSIDLFSLLNDLLKNMGPVHHNGFSLKTEIIADSINLNIQNAIPVGSIVTELFTNSIKHAFKGIKEGNITITVKKLSKKTPELEMIYKDNGTGLPLDFNLNDCETLGFTIITSFVEQLNGHMSVANKEGAEFRFLFRI